MDVRSTDVWPMDVVDSDQSIPVFEREGRPSVLLSAGQHDLSGKFLWDTMPQRIAVPREIGILTLTVEGQSISMPNWDANGQVWLKRIRNEVTEKDLLTVQVYRVIEDDIPTRLDTNIEITVSGKSREESLGWILPEGFRLSTVNSPLPVAVDAQGHVRRGVQVVEGEGGDGTGDHAGPATAQ